MAGFLETVAGPRVMQSPWAQRLQRLPADRRVALTAALLAALLFIPYLGAVGLWDPWETHYGEVAREMIQRNDYVYPYWETSWFFSKPPLTMWMQGLASALVLSTSPLYFLLTRQTVTDTPFVTSLTCAMACALIAHLDPGTRHR